MKLRLVLRQNTNEIGNINATEYEYAVNVRDFLATINVNSAQGPTWPSVASVDALIGRLRDIEARRTRVQDDLIRVRLLGPLPVAVRDDVVEVLGERLAVNRDWRIQLTSLRTALQNSNDIVSGDAARRLGELFEAYGPLQNTLTIAADDLEEQLRLPWNEDNQIPYQKEPPPPPGH